MPDAPVMPTNDEMEAMRALVKYGEAVTFANGVTIDKRPLVGPMSTTSWVSTGSGYSCASCHTWVPLGSYHTCGGQTARGVTS